MNHCHGPFWRARDSEYWSIFFANTLSQHARLLGREKCTLSSPITPTIFFHRYCIANRGLFYHMSTQTSPPTDLGSHHPDWVPTVGYGRHTICTGHKGNTRDCLTSNIPPTKSKRPSMFVRYAKSRHKSTMRRRNSPPLSWRAMHWTMSNYPFATETRDSDTRWCQWYTT